MSFTDYDKCSLLLPMDGSNGGTTFTDWSPTTKTVTANGNAQTSTAQSKYYGSSGLFDGTGDYLSSARALPLSDDFTIAVWARVPAILSTQQAMVSQKDLSTNNAGRFNFAIDATANSGVLLMFIGAGTSLVLRSTSTVPVNSWTHLAATKSSNVYRIFIDGVLENTSSTFTQTLEDQPTYIGEYANGSYFAGNMQDVLIIEGTALWTSDFTPPSRLIGEISGTVYDSTGTEAARTIIAVPRSYPTKVYTTTSSGVDGTYSLRVPATEVTRVAFADDVAEGATYNDIIDRIIPE